MKTFEDGVCSESPTQAEAEEAIRTLIRWAGDDPSREGLIDTPRRVANAYHEFFSGYAIDPKDILQTTYEHVDGYQDIVLLKNIRFESHCEHHMAPIIGTAHVAYLPHKKVIGISKLARLVEIYSRRFQLQERLTAQIAQTLQEILQPRGTAVLIQATHQCMTTRGIHKPGVKMITKHFTGLFQNDLNERNELYTLLHQI